MNDICININKVAYIFLDNGATWKTLKDWLVGFQDITPQPAQGLFKVTDVYKYLEKKG